MSKDATERDYCTVLDIIAKDGGYDDFVKAIHMACLSSVLTTKRRIVLIPPDRKGLTKKNPTEPLRQLIIPFIRGVKRNDPITDEVAFVDGTQLVAIEGSAAYDVSGNGSKAKIGGAKISKILRARNGLAVILDSNPSPSPLQERPEPKKKGGGIGGLKIRINLGPDNRAVDYLTNLNGPDLRESIAYVYKQYFPPPAKWYDHFSAAFTMYMRYNDALFRTYTLGVNPYQYYYRTILSRPSYVATGAILMPYLRQRTYIIPDALLVNFIRSNWWCYNNPSLFTIAHGFIQNGGADDGKEDADSYKKELEQIIARVEAVKDQPILSAVAAPDANFAVKIYEYDREKEKYNDVEHPLQNWKAILYVDLLHYLHKKNDKHTNEEKKLIVEYYLRSFDDAIKATYSMNTMTQKVFADHIVKHLKDIRDHFDQLLDGVVTDDKSLEPHFIARHKIDSNANNEIKRILNTL